MIVLAPTTAAGGYGCGTPDGEDGDGASSRGPAKADEYRVYRLAHGNPTEFDVSYFRGLLTFPELGELADLSHYREDDDGNLVSPPVSIDRHLMSVVVGPHAVNWLSESPYGDVVSALDIDNTIAQLDSAFSQGRYALVNLLATPAPNLMCGVELQYGYRENYNDGWEVDDLKLQVSFKYSFSHIFGGKE